LADTNGPRDALRHTHPVVIVLCTKLDAECDPAASAPLILNCWGHINPASLRQLGRGEIADRSTVTVNL